MEDKKSLAYRKNEGAIWNADPPLKYTRLLPYITGNRIIEVGAAEGVLSLLLAPNRQRVIAVEKHEDRHRMAVALQKHYREDLGLDVGRCQMVLGDIRGMMNLFEGMDTLVMIRSVYYLREDAQRVINEAGKHVGTIVMCGNQNRAANYWKNAIGPDDGLGRWNYLASIEGMSELMERAGYLVEKTVREGDPIVVGRWKLPWS